MKIGYICDYCPSYDREILKEEEAKEHEKTCYWNPQNKHCLTCRLFNTVKYPSVDNMGKSFMNSTQGCIDGHNPINSCMISNCSFYKNVEKE